MDGPCRESALGFGGWKLVWEGAFEVSLRLMRSYPLREKPTFGANDEISRIRLPHLVSSSDLKYQDRSLIWLRPKETKRIIKNHLIKRSSDRVFAVVSSVPCRFPRLCFLQLSLCLSLPKPPKPSAPDFGLPLKFLIFSPLIGTFLYCYVCDFYISWSWTGCV